ncbi:MAG: hypothetical protein PHS14_00905 [Elusimicrobia bacterium]|nr:hypothetical protein [Elusimicrobiota bacterium]
MTTRAMSRYLIEDAMERVERDFSAKGYKIERELRVGGQTFDLVAKNEAEEIIFEFKIYGAGANDDKHVRRIHEYVKKDPARQMRLVLITPPTDRQIEIVGLEAQLEEHFHNNFPSELDEVSTHTRLEEVTDINISSVSWGDKGAHVIGEGLLGVSLQYGSDRETDGDPEIHDSYPFKFDVTLDSDREIAEVHSTNVDNSDFYAD